MINRRIPKYPNDTDYTTNSPSYYDDLARKQHLIKLLAEKIHGYDKELAKRFEQWDKNLEEFPEDVKQLLEKWLSDGTIDHIINDTIFNWKADQVDLDKTNEKVNELDQLIELLTTDKADQDVHYMSATRFGVIGDGETDDTNALQEALDTRQPIALPTGTFKITSPLRLYSDTKLKGQGIFKSVLKPEGNIIAIDGSDDLALIDIRLSDFGIEGNHSPDSIGIKLNYLTNNSIVENMRVENMSKGFVLTKAWYASLNRLRLTRNDKINFEIYSPSNIQQVNNLLVQNSSFFIADNNIVIHGGAPNQNIKFLSCEIEGSRDVGVYARNVAPLVFDSCYFERNHTNAQTGQGTKILTTNDAIDIDYDCFRVRDVLKIVNCYLNRSNNFNSSSVLVSILLREFGQIILEDTILQCNSSNYIDYDVYSNSAKKPRIQNNSWDGFSKNIYHGEKHYYYVDHLDNINFQYTSQSRAKFITSQAGNYHLKIIANEPLDLSDRTYSIRVMDKISNEELSIFPIDSMNKGEVKTYPIGSISVPMIELVVNNQTEEQTDLTYILEREDIK